MSQRDDLITLRQMIDHAREAKILMVDFPQLISKLEAFFTDKPQLSEPR